MSREIEAARREGSLSRRAARQARRLRDHIGTLADRYAADGELSLSERRELDTRTELLRGEVNRERLLAGPPR